MKQSKSAGGGRPINTRMTSDTIDIIRVPTHGNKNISCAYRSSFWIIGQSIISVCLFIHSILIGKNLHFAAVIWLAGAKNKSSTSVVENTSIHMTWHDKIWHEITSKYKGDECTSIFGIVWKSIKVPLMMGKGSGSQIRNHPCPKGPCCKTIACDGKA